MHPDIETAYVQAMTNADWANDRESLAAMWSDASAEDLLAIAQYLTARADRLVTVSRPSRERLVTVSGS